MYICTCTYIKYCHTCVSMWASIHCMQVERRNVLTSEMVQCHAHQVPLAPWLVVVDVHFAKQFLVVDVLSSQQAGEG